MFKDMRNVFGVFLILAGVAAALQQFGILGGQWNDALFVGLFAIGAVYFYNRYRENQVHWWFGLLALLLAGLSISNLLDIFLPAIGEIISGAIVLGAIGAGFLIAYLRNRSNWWAIIPAGVMFSLAAVSVADSLPGSLPFDSGGLLFFGMGLTFLALSFMTTGGQRLAWGIFPAIVLIAFGFFVGFGQAASWNYIWPALIILFGLYFLVSSLRRT
jgi:hypothetical protein